MALQARVAVRRIAVLRQRQPRMRGGRGDGVHHHAQRPRHRARRRDRQHGLGPGVRRCAGRRERDGRSADRQGHGDRRELGRGVRGARPRRRVQARDRRAGLALLHGPEARRAGVRDLARRRRGVAAGRRKLLDHAHLRPGPQPPVLQHRQSVPGLRRGRPRGRQPLHRLRRRGRSGQRSDQVALPVHPARRVGLRLDDGEHPVRPRRAEVLRRTSTRTGTSSSSIARTAA